MKLIVGPRGGKATFRLSPCPLLLAQRRQGPTWTAPLRASHRGTTMAIYATCPECDASQKLRDDQEGTKVKCKECGSSFKARADEDDRPRKKRRRDTEDQPSGGGWGLIISGPGGRCLRQGVGPPSTVEFPGGE